MTTTGPRAATLAIALAAVLAAGFDAAPARAQWSYDRFERVPGPHRWGPRCMERITTRGKATVKLFSNSDKKKARARAVDNWSEQVAGAFGPQYANWQWAKGQELDCKTRGFEVICSASAHPCR